MKRNNFLGLLVVFMFAVAVALGATALQAQARTNTDTSTQAGAASAGVAAAPSVSASTAQTTTVQPATGSSGAVAAFESTLEQIYAQVNPSVVSINVTIPAQSTQSPFGQLGPNFGQQGPQYSQALGSGFVWDKQGHIVTNNHVVEGADQIQVVFYDGTTASAQVVGTDPESDLAVLQVNVPASELHPVQMADSTQIKVGQLAIAIGNPFGQAGTMTAGIVSAIGRYLPANGGTTTGPNYTIPDIIQTDAPINPGNSGGVLVDENGQVMGVTAAIESPVRANAGIGYAIPSAIVKKVVPSLIETGTYQHPRMGLSGTTLTPDLAQAMNLPADQRGALVIDVTPGGPADQAGIQGSTGTAQILGQEVPVGGDVIIAINGQPVKTFEDLVAYLANQTSVGDTVTLTVLRDGQQMQISVTLEVGAALQAGSQAQPGQTQGVQLGILGIAVTSQIAQAMDLPSNQQGVLVEQVQPGSAAEQAGLQGSDTPATINGQQMMVGGDIITAMDGQSVSTVQDLRALLADIQPGGHATLTILRGGQEMQVPVTFNDATVVAP
jgi:serine protease Do